VGRLYILTPAEIKHKLKSEGSHKWTTHFEFFRLDSKNRSFKLQSLETDPYRPKSKLKKTKVFKAIKRISHFLLITLVEIDPKT